MRERRLVRLVLTFPDPGRERRRSVFLRDGLVVGRDSGPDRIVIDAPGIAQRHAEIVVDGDGAPSIRASSPDAALFVNGRLVDSAVLSAGDAVQLGTVAARVVRDSDRSWSEAPRVPAPAQPSRQENLLHRRGTREGLLAVAGLAAFFLIGRFLASGKPAPMPAPAPTPAATFPVRRETPSLRPTPIPFPTRRPMPSTPSVPSRAYVVRPGQPGLDEVLRAVVGITHTEGSQGQALGSGFIATPGGLVVTNAHVVAGTADVQVILRDGSRVWARVVDTDSLRDVALVRLPRGSAYPSLAVESTSAVRVGESVWAVGFPYSESLAFTVTRGIVSGVRTLPDGSQFVQHDAAINPGNSGGPLVGESGRVLGINTWKLAGNDRLGFAVTGDTILDFLRGRDE